MTKVLSVRLSLLLILLVLTNLGTSFSGFKTAPAPGCSCLNAVGMRFTPASVELLGGTTSQVTATTDVESNWKMIRPPASEVVESVSIAPDSGSASTTITIKARPDIPLPPRSPFGATLQPQWNTSLEMRAVPIDPKWGTGWGTLPIQAETPHIGLALTGYLIRNLVPGLNPEGAVSLTVWLDRSQVLAASGEWSWEAKYLGPLDFVYFQGNPVVTVRNGSSADIGCRLKDGISIKKLVAVPILVHARKGPVILEGVLQFAIHPG